MNPEQLPARQQEILSFTKTHVTEHGYAPTIREIMTKVRLKSPSGIHRHLKVLETKGFIETSDGKFRSIELSDGGIKKIFSEKQLPLIGHVQAGVPTLSEENVEGHFNVSEIAKAQEGDFILKVEGESMIDAGIKPGDYVVVRQQTTAENGEIVIALVDDSETTNY